MDIDMILLVSFVAVGLYCLYTGFRLSREKALFDSFILYPGNCKRDDCLDPEGFRDFMRSRITILGAMCVVIGLFYLVKINYSVPMALTIVHMVLSAAALGWGFWIYARAAKRFW